MLRRDRQMRAQVNQLVDAFLFAASFWLVAVLRSDPQIIEWLKLKTLPADAYLNVGWLYFVLIPGAPFLFTGAEIATIEGADPGITGTMNGVTFRYYAVASYSTLVTAHGFELVNVYDDPGVSTYYLARKIR